MWRWLPLAIGLITSVVAFQFAVGQDAPAPVSETDGSDTDAEPVAVGPLCEAGTVEVEGRCIQLPVFAEIPASKVMMGSPKEEQGRDKDEIQREVEVAAFSMSVHEITQAQFELIVGDNPAAGCGLPSEPELPAACVSWHDAVRFCNDFSKRLGLDPVYSTEAGVVVWKRDANGVRLPTEAEWEAAARAGLGSTLAGGDNPGSVAWYVRNADKQAHSVGTLRPTTHGVYDLSGNVAEWVWDGYSSKPDGADPAELDALPVRVQKGGSFRDSVKLLRVAARDYDRWDVTEPTVGFRVVKPSGGGP